MCIGLLYAGPQLDRHPMYIAMVYHIVHDVIGTIAMIQDVLHSALWLAMLLYVLI